MTQLLNVFGVGTCSGRDRRTVRKVWGYGIHDQISTALPDLRAIRLEEMPALPSAALDQVVQRVLRGSPMTPALGTAFGSSI